MDVEMIRGDAIDLEIAVTNDAGTAAQSLTGAVIRFMVKRDPADAAANAVVAKRSYSSTEVEITDAANGLATIHIAANDTADADPGTCLWETEITRQGTEVTATGTLTATAGSGEITLVGGTIALFAEGMVLVPAGAGGSNDEVCVITSVDEVNNRFTTDYEGWTAQSLIAFSLKKGLRATPTGLSGKFQILADVVR